MFSNIIAKIFGDFCKFPAKNGFFSLENQCPDDFLPKLAEFLEFFDSF
jgi:hypothetical protein